MDEFIGKNSKAEQRERVGIRGRCKRRVESEYFHLFLWDVRTYFDQTGGDCGKTQQDCFGEFYYVYAGSE